ncbi:DUF3817 domain-containing protein [Solicola sp. PLA-1-18]|uniref:DUF3817 domain-containing protein n=1 Tax=Solicola sp. PLA-1-18 TaxID=3380532 RepID=UPI003B763DBB
MSQTEPLTSVHTPLRRAFAVVAFAEAASWAGLLVGMYFKWIAGTTERGVEVMGPIHGAMFVLYVVVALLCWRTFRWSPLVLLAALAASIPPFATVVFERWSERSGRHIWQR